MNNGINYTTINHNARLALKISVLEYCVADLIYNLANNPDSKVPNWCYASKETLGNMLGISKQSVHSIVNKLIKIGVLERDEKMKFLKTNGAWYATVLVNSKESLPLVKNLDVDSKESLHNKDIDNVLITHVINKGSSKKTPSCPLEVKGHEDLKAKYPNGHRECAEYFASVQDERGNKFVNPGKQFKAIHNILRAGFTFKSMDWAIDRMEKDRFYQDGWDFTSVANYLDKKSHASKS